MNDNTIDKNSLMQDIKQLGVQAGDILHLKVSMRSIGNIKGGAATLLNVLLDIVGKEGTLVSDAFIDVFPLPLNKQQESIIADDNTKSYAGAFANEMIKHTDMRRSKHPVQKYVAIGKLAENLCYNHIPESGAYDLLNEMAKMGAKNLTIGTKVLGVGTTHVAIDLLGFKRKLINKGVNYRTTNDKVKLAKVNWNGGCAKGFSKFIPYYRNNEGVLGEANIGNAIGLLTSMKKTLQIEMGILKEHPDFFFCDDKSCYSCQMTWEHSPKKIMRFYFNWLKRNYKGLSLSRLRNLRKTVSKSSRK